MSDHNNWYNDLVGTDSKVTASDRAGIPTSTLSHQLRKGHMAAETVISLARGYGRNPVDALAETGFIRPDEAARIGRATIRMFSDQQIIRDVMRRINANPDAWGFMVGDEPPVDSNGNVTPIRPVSDDDLPAVADSSPDNPEEDIEFDD